MTRQVLTALVSLVILTIACNNNNSNKEKSVDDKLAESTRDDSASEATMLNPKFDADKIYGLGIFKIGATYENTIAALLATNSYKFDSLSTMEQKSKFDVDHILDKRKFIVKIKPPKSTLNRFNDIDNSSWCKDTKVCWVTKYLVDNLKIENVIATYYKNKLVKISCDWTSDLLNAVESKYGKPDEKYTDLNQKPIYSSTHWNNQEIQAGYTSLSHLKFDIDIKGGFKFLYGCSERDFKEQDKIDKSNNKSKLKNF
jgi:hypothetical protein